MAESLTEKTVLGVLWQFLGSGLESLSRIVVLIVLARLLSPEDFGVVGAAMVIIGFTQIFSQIGITQSLVQRLELDDGHIKSGFGFSLIFGLALGVAVWCAARFTADFFKMPSVEPILQFLALYFPLSAPGIVAESLLLREMRFRHLALVDVASYLVGYALVGIWLAVAGFGAWSLAAAVAAQAALRSTLLLILRFHGLGIWGGVKPLKDLLFFGAGMTISQVGNFAALQADNLVVGRWMGAEALGLYGRAYQFLTFPTNMFGQVVNRVLFPAMASVQNDPERLSRAFLRSLGLVAMITLPVTMLLVVLGREFAVVLLGPRWIDMALPFQILAATLMFRTSYKMSDSLARATGAVYRRAWRQWAYAGAVFFGALLGTHWGLVGVSFFVGLAILINFFLMLHLGVELTGLSWRSLAIVHLRHLAASLPVLAVTIVAVAIARNLGLADITTLFLATAAWGLTLLCQIIFFPSFFGDEAEWVKLLVRKLTMRFIGPK